MPQKGSGPHPTATRGYSIGLPVHPALRRIRSPPCYGVASRGLMWAAGRCYNHVYAADARNFILQPPDLCEKTEHKIFADDPEVGVKLDFAQFFFCHRG